MEICHPRKSCGNKAYIRAPTNVSFPVDFTNVDAEQVEQTDN